MNRQNPLTTSRKSLAEALQKAGLPSHEVLPQSINTKTAAALGWTANPVEDTHETFAGERVQRLALYLVVRISHAAAEAAAFEDVLSIALPVIAAQGWTVSDFDQPDVLTFGAWEMFGSQLTITRPTYL